MGVDTALRTREHQRVPYDPQMEPQPLRAAQNCLDEFSCRCSKRHRSRSPHGRPGLSRCLVSQQLAAAGEECSKCPPPWRPGCACWARDGRTRTTHDARSVAVAAMRAPNLAIAGYGGADEAVRELEQLVHQ
ncbi:MAG: hypothetical protein LC808_00070 [Actinobacteria bacterium]|nr:hypothetical protein [Actinomycetota bacterium]